MTNIKPLLGIGAASLVSLNGAGQQPQKRPNILWISTEDLSPHFGCYGDKVAKTPNIDRLASQGIRYTQCIYNSSHQCSGQGRNNYRDVPDINRMYAHENNIIPEISGESCRIYCCTSSLCKSIH